MKLIERARYIAIEGNIGAGKTSLAKSIAEETGAVLMLEEFAENAFLPQFYKDPVKYAFPLEMSFLAARYKQLSEQLTTKLHVPVISDYHIRKSLLFAEHNLAPAELQLFRSFYDIIAQQAKEPDLVIFLHRNVDNLKKNITKRGRAFEQDITEKYLAGINEAYETLLKNHPFSQLIRIDVNELDFINNRQHYEFIINQIESSQQL